MRGSSTPRPVDSITAVSGILDHPLSRVMTVVGVFTNTPSHSRGACRPRFAVYCRPRKEEGAGKAGCALHPRSRVQNCTKKRTRAYRSSGGIPAFPARWFTAYTYSPRRSGFACHRRRRNYFRRLDANLEASGPHDFAVRSNCARQSQLSRPPHPTARS